MALFVFLAERAGFEPAVRYKRTLAFQASALSLSATSPKFRLRSTPDIARRERVNGGRPARRPAGRLTRCILHLALRASSLCSAVQIGCPADLWRFKIAPGDFVSLSATSPSFQLQSVPR